MLCSTLGRDKESRYRLVCCRMASGHWTDFYSAPLTELVIVAFAAAVIVAPVTANSTLFSGLPVWTVSDAGLPQSFTSSSSATMSMRHKPVTAMSSSHQQQIVTSAAASLHTSELPTMASEHAQLPMVPPLYTSSHTTMLQNSASPEASSFYDSQATKMLAIESAELQSANVTPSSSPYNESLVTATPVTGNSQATATLVTEKLQATAPPVTGKLQATATRSFESPAMRSLFVNTSKCEHPDGVLLRPSALWQFFDVSVTAENASCRVTIESLRDNVGSGRHNASSAGVTLDDTSHSTEAKASRLTAEPQFSGMPQSLLVLRLVSWHPGSECSMETCSRPRTAQEWQQPTPSTSRKNGESRCAVALSFATPIPAAGREPTPTGGSASHSSASTLILDDRGSPDALTTIAWTDASLNTTVNVSGCCGIRLLLGYKIARARNACVVRSQPPPPSTGDTSASSSFSSYSSSQIYSSSSSQSSSFIPSSQAQHPSLLSSSQPSLQPPSFTSSSAKSGSFLRQSSSVPLTAVSSASTGAFPKHQTFNGELLKKYTYVFAQDRQLARMTSSDGVGNDDFEYAVVCKDTLDYELQMHPTPATTSDAALDVRIDLQAVPGSRSCWRLCIDDNCSLPLGSFNSSGGRALRVRYQRHRPAAGAAKGSDGACDENEYSGFTLRLLTPSNVAFAAVASSVDGDEIAESSLQAIAAGAAGLLLLCAAATVIALLAIRRRRVRRRLRGHNSAEQRKQRHQHRKLPRQPTDNQETEIYSEPVDFVEFLELRSSIVVEDSENYAEIAMEENIQAPMRAVGHGYSKLKRAAQAAAAAAAAAAVVASANSNERIETAAEHSSIDESEHVYSELLS